MNSSGGRGARNPFDREECVRSRGADNCSLPFARSEKRKGQRSDARDGYAKRIEAIGCSVDCIVCLDKKVLNISNNEKYIGKHIKFYFFIS